MGYPRRFPARFPEGQTAVELSMTGWKGFLACELVLTASLAKTYRVILAHNENI